MYSLALLTLLCCLLFDNYWRCSLLRQAPPMIIKSKQCKRVSNARLLNVAVIYSCVIHQELHVAIVNFLLMTSHEINKILVKSVQSLRVKFPRFIGLEIKVIHLVKIHYHQ